MWCSERSDADRCGSHGEDAQVWLASVPPVLVNMAVVGGYLSFLLDIPFLLCAL